MDMSYFILKNLCGRRSSLPQLLQSLTASFSQNSHKLTSVMCDTLNTILSHQAPHRPHHAPTPSSKCLHHSLYQRLRLAVLWLAVQLLIGITPANKIIFILVFRKSWSLNIITFHLIFLRQFPIKTEYKFLIAQLFVELRLW